MIEYIAFYGTLQSSGSTPVHKIINDNLQYVSNCTIQGQLFSKGRYPALKEGDGRVVGELYRICDDDVLHKLDKYEAYDNKDLALPGFTRKLVKHNELIVSGRWN